MSKLGIAFFSLGLAVAFPLVASAETVEVTASALNIRTGPSTSYARLGTAQRGQRLTVRGRSGSWVKVEFNGRDGWGHGNYLRSLGNTGGGGSTGTTTRTVTASALNVRSGPSTRYRVLGTLRSGAQVQVRSTSGGWSQINYGNGTGWVASSYLGSGGGGTGGGGTSGRRSRAGFIQLSTSGANHFGYYAASKRWGTPTMVYGILRVAARFQRENPGAPRLGCGDISLENGGDIAGHASHERGVDADFRPHKNNGTTGPVTIYQSTYSRSLTNRILRIFEAEMPVTHIGFQDSRITGVPHRRNWTNHANHYHVRTSR